MPMCFLREKKCLCSFLWCSRRRRSVGRVAPPSVDPADACHPPTVHMCSLFLEISDADAGYTGRVPGKARASVDQTDKCYPCRPNCSHLAATPPNRWHQHQQRATLSGETCNYISPKWHGFFPSMLLRCEKKPWSLRLAKSFDRCRVCEAVSPPPHSSFLCCRSRSCSQRVLDRTTNIPAVPCPPRSFGGCLLKQQAGQDADA